MDESLDKFIIVQKDYFLASGKDVECAAILKLIESLARSSGGEVTSWVNITANAIERMTFGVIPKRGVSRKIKTLKSRGLIEVCLRGGNWPYYRLKPDFIKQTALLESRKTYTESDEPTQNVDISTHNEQDARYTQNVSLNYTKCDAIYSIYRIKKEASVTNTVVDTYEAENSSLPLKGKESVSIADQVDKAVDMEKEEEEQHNTNISQAVRPLIEKTEKIQNSEVSTETEVVQNEEKENNMNEDVRVVLKSYDKIPKNKRGSRDRGSLSALYRQYGDAIEKLINEHGLEQVLNVMEVFKNDQYCVDKQFPLSLFIFRVKNYSKNASQNAGGYHGVGEQEKIAPRAVSAQTKPTPVIPVDGDPHAEYRQIIRDRHHRVRDVTFMVKVVEPDKLKEFENLTVDVSKVDPAVVEGWFAEYFSRWKETHGGFEPTCRSKPIC
jgi:DNA-binding transcriptional ArsR family regulator